MRELFLNRDGLLWMMFLRRYKAIHAAVEKTVTGALLHITDALAKPAKKFVATLEPIQSGSGDPSPDNVRPITGWTGVNVMRTGKNLLDVTQNESGGIDASGVEVTGSTFRRSSNYISCKPNIEYTLSANSNYTLRLYFYDINKNFISPRYQGTNAKVSATSPDNAAFIRWSIYNANQEITEEETLALNLQLELGSTASTYEPFSGTTIPITFPGAAGTVYGGTLTNEDGKWKLRVTWAKVKLNQFSFATLSSPNIHVFRSEYTSVIPNAARPKNDSSFWDALCDTFSYKPYNPISRTDHGKFSITASSSTDRIVFVDHRFDTVEDFEADNANVEIVYPLVTPTTYTLTESQALTLLKGTNNIWVDDSDDLELTYLAKAGTTP